MGQRSFYFIYLFFFFFTLTNFPSFAYAKATPEKLYQRARRDYYSLKGSREKQSNELGWKGCIKKFLLVYQKFPKSSLADDALFTAGNLYYDSFKWFHKKKDLNFALKYYKEVTEKYSDSRLADDALFQIAEIQFHNLKKYAEAYNSYTRVIKEFPQGDMVKSALKKIKDISPFYKVTQVDQHKKISVIEIKQLSKPGYTRIVIELDGMVKFKKHMLSNPERVYVDLFNSVIEERLVNNPININNGLIKRVRANQHQPGIVRVVLDIDNYTDIKVFSLKKLFQIAIDVVNKPAFKKGLPRLAVVASVSKTIVIDPGHGGKDYGAKGAKGLLEKEVVLDISLKLKKLIEKSMGYKVILTRSSDVFIQLKERTAIANSNNADLFISVHANASKRKMASGIETYYLDFAKSGRALETAARENKTPLSKIRDDVQYILADMVANTKMNKSSQLAGIIQNSLIKGIRKNFKEVKDLQAKGGPFYVLYGASMPSVLVETSFISNPVEGKRLRSAWYRERIAQCILNGVKRFFSELRVAEKKSPKR